MEHSEIEISINSRRFLLKLARDTITDYLSDLYMRKYKASKLSVEVTQESGAFVSLYKFDQLRGCIGRFNSERPLFRLIQELAINSAFRDYRFDPVTFDELNDIEIEISILSPLKKISSINEFNPAQHGIYITKGGKSGTFLPQVATKTNWSKEQLLSHCSRDKAGLGWDGWKNAELYIYSTLIISENDFRDTIK